MDLNLDTLKSGILEYLEASEFAVFRSHPGGLETLPMVCWDCERYPDYRMFLDAASKTGARMIIFAAREFELDEVDETLEQLGECEMDRDERREFERKLRSFRTYEGITCSLELAFDYQSRMYVYELRPDWYEEFEALCDEISMELPVGDDDETDESLGGFYSNN